jgi:outer membrane protein assembly factor BamB
VNRDESNNRYTNGFFSVPLYDAWQVSGNGVISKPIAVEGKVFFVDEQGTVFAVDLDSGGVIWEERIDQVEGADVGLAYGDGQLYLAAYDGIVYAIDATNGHIVWSYDSHGGINSSPIIYGNKILIGNWAGQLIALNVQDGDLEWMFQTAEIFGSTVAVSDNLAFVTSRDGLLHAIDIASGDEKWQLYIGDVANGRTPVVRDGTLYVSTSYSVHSIDALTGKELWSQPLRGLFPVESLAVDEYLVYVSISDEYTVLALDIRNGEVRWRTELLGLPSDSAPVVTSRFLLTRLSLGDVDSLVVLDKFRGGVIWKKEIPIGSNQTPILVGHTVIANAYDKLVAWQSKPGELLLFFGQSIRKWDPFQDQIEDKTFDIFYQECEVLPASDKLVCAGISKMRWDLYTIDWATGETIRLTDFTGKGNAAISVSPCGEKVAFAFGTDAGSHGSIIQGELYVTDLASGESKKITNNYCGTSYDVSWSPYGDWLMFPSCTNEDSTIQSADVAIMRVLADGAPLETIATIDHVSNLALSPDGLWIPHVFQESLTLMSADGNREVPIYATESPFLISWSPSGQQIASQPWVDHGTGVFVSNANGSDGHWLLQYDGNVYPGFNPYSWSLDSQYIAHVERDKVSILDACTGNTIKSQAFDGRPALDVRWIP